MATHTQEGGVLFVLVNSEQNNSAEFHVTFDAIVSRICSSLPGPIDLGNISFLNLQTFGTFLLLLYFTFGAIV